MKEDLTQMTTDSLLRLLDAVRYEIAAWKGGLAEGVYFYGTTNASVVKQLVEDEAEAAAIQAELDRRKGTPVLP